MNSKQEKIQEALTGRQLLLQEIGQQLLQAREEKREALHKPVRKLKIPINHLEALESGNWDALPDDVYVIGFLRQYSTYLDIDLSTEINRLKNSDYSLTRPLTFPDPPVAPSRRWAWLTGGAFVLLFIIFNVINTNHVDEETVQADSSAPVLAVQKKAGIQKNKLTNEVHLNVHETNSLQTDDKAASAHETNTIGTATVATQLAKSPATHTRLETPSTAISTIATPITAIPTALAPTLASTPVSKPRRHTFRFEAVTAPVWIQIFAPNKAGTGKGRLIKEMLLKKGHHSNIRRRTESLWITCGNALALRIRVDKKIVVDTGELGAGKKVLRDYHFDLNHFSQY